MHNTPAPPPESAVPDIRHLEQRVRRLSRAVAVLTTLCLVLSASGFVRSAREPGPVATDSVLVLRALSIVDGNGVERVRLAAPLPDPIMLGRRFPRGEFVSGMMLYDSEGNERGGYITDEDRGAALTLDEINRAAIHLGVSDRGEAHLSLSNGRGGYALLSMRPAGSFLSVDGKLVAVATDSQPGR